MQIITIPHSTLRAKAKEITKIDKKLIKFVKNLEQTLADARNPQGVGLAAPQVDKTLRVFTTQLPDETQTLRPELIKHYINPVITNRSPKLILGETANDKEAREEGCLSMPGLYGPVPRAEWIELLWFELDGNELVKKEARFDNFPARVIQHELDHLDGILFTDYSIKYDLPVYKESRLGKWVEVDKSELEKI